MISTASSEPKADSILAGVEGCNEDDINPDEEDEMKEEELEVDTNDSDKDCEIPDHTFDNEDNIEDDFEVDAKEEEEGEEAESEDDQDEDYEADIASSRQQTKKRSPRKKAVSIPGFCAECNREFANLAQHRYHQHPSQPRPALTCSLCDKVFFGQRRNFDAHMRRHTQPFLPCPKCGKQIKESALEKHLKYTHKEKPDIACTFPDCNQMFKQPQTLQNHIRKVHEKEKSLCVNCGETVSHLYQHKLTCCPDEKTLEERTCSICRKSYSNKAQRELHEQMVHGKAKVCPVCGKTVKWLESHMKNKHTERGKAHTCAEDGCGKSFKTSAELKVHHIGVHQKLRSQCPECDKWFTVHHLKTHMKRVHSII